MRNPAVAQISAVVASSGGEDVGESAAVVCVAIRVREILLEGLVNLGRSVHFSAAGTAAPAVMLRFWAGQYVAEEIAAI